MVGPTQKLAISPYFSVFRVDGVWRSGYLDNTGGGVLGVGFGVCSLARVQAS